MAALSMLPCSAVLPSDSLEQKLQRGMLQVCVLCETSTAYFVRSLRQPVCFQCMTLVQS